MLKRKITTFYILCALLLLISLSLPVIARAQGAGQTGTQLDQYINEQMAQKNIVGMSVAIVQDNEILYLKGFGSASLKKQTSVTPQTIFDLASCSKSFTALATLLLWNDGKIDLDAPLKNYIPEFRLENSKSSDEITVRQLLNQTSGIPGTIYEPVGYHQGPTAMVEMVKSMEKTRINRPPGSSFEYSNLNYSLLGALVERVSGKTFEDFVQERIFTPLGMNDSTLIPQIAASRDRADGHQMMLGKIITRNTPIYESIQPAGWVMSSAEDMAKWLLVNMNDGYLNGRQVVPSAVIELMQTPSAKIVKEGENTNYAMGWFTGKTKNGEPVIWHGGDTPNFLSEVIILPERNLGIVMLVNSQTSRNAHSVAVGIASLFMGYELKLPSSPWWASWAAIDQIALITVILSGLLLLGLIPYILWQTRIIKRYRRREKIQSPIRKTVKIWVFAIPVTPWIILAVISTTAYVVVQILFGFNLFQTLIRFGTFAPPGVLIGAISFAVSIVCWAATITVIGFLRTAIRVKYS